MQSNHVNRIRAGSVTSGHSTGFTFRLLSLFVAMVLAVSMVPGTAWATTSDTIVPREQSAATTLNDKPETIASIEGVPATSDEPAQPSVAAAISVNFSLVGDSVHGATGHVAYETWLADAAYEIAPMQGGNVLVLDVMKHVLDAKHYAYTVVDSTYGPYLTDITTPAGIKLSSGDNGAYGGWGYTVNGVSPQDGIGVHVVSAGDKICVKYTDGAEWGGQPPAPTPDVVLPSYDSTWPNYQGDDGTTTLPTAKSAEEVVLEFKSNLKGEAAWVNLSDPIIVNDDIYVAANDKMYLIDKTGAIKKSAPLMQSIGFTCRPVYAAGKILVPLDGGRIQALAADTLQTVWVSNALYENESGGVGASGHQSDTKLTLVGDSLFFGTYAPDASYKLSVGVYRCLDVITGSTKWTHTNKDGGYYWSGAVYLKNCDSVVVAGEDGKLTSLAAADGVVRGSYEVGATVRSSVVALDATTVVVSDRAGVLHKVSVASDGVLTEGGRVQFAASSTSTPTIHEGRAIVGGGLGADGGYRGVLAVIDLATMQVIQRITAPAEVQSAPLVSVQDDGVYLYFTANKAPGGVYVAKLGAGDGEAVALYVPEGDDANYCNKSVIVGADGTLYYTNDSGNLFALSKKKVDSTPVDPIPGAPILTPGAQNAETGPTTSATAASASANPAASMAKTGDSVPLAVGILIGCGAMGVLLFSMRKMRQQRGR